MKREASCVVRPVNFSQGINPDKRELGVAVDYVRFVASSDR